MIKAFEQLDGLRFYAQREAFELKAGLYGNGRGALSVFTVAGECEMVLTVNLPEYEPLAEDDIIVRWAASGGAIVDDRGVSGHPVWRKIDSLYLFCDTRIRIDSGYVDAYGAVWQMAKCIDRRHGQPGSQYIAECSACRGAMTADYERTRQIHLAQESVAMLRNEDR